MSTALQVLLDQHISPRLVSRLARKGIFAQYIGHLGRARISDPDLWRYAFAQGQIVVTANARDYIRLAAGSEVHAGLIILRLPDLSAEEQWRHLEPVIDHLLAAGLDPTNHVIEIWDIGRFDIRPIPPT